MNEVSMPMRASVPPKRNGPAMKDLPEESAAAVERGLASHFKAIAERDALQKQIAEMEIELSATKKQVEALQGMVTMMESRVHSCQIERDAAVAERAKFETLFVQIAGTLRTFNIPSNPVIMELADHITDQQQHS